jgi:hypothetical protein
LYDSEAGGRWTGRELADDNLGMSDEGLNEDEMQQLLALRAAAIRHAPSPAIPAEVASRLARLGYVYTSPGGTVISNSGLALLEGYFLFCRAPGCDGILRRWTYLPGGTYGGCHPDDPELQPKKAGGFYLQCPKCGSCNLLKGTEHPERIGDYEVIGVVPSR